jgi:hypothetical protein
MLLFYIYSHLFTRIFSHYLSNMSTFHMGNIGGSPTPRGPKTPPPIAPRLHRYRSMPPIVGVDARKTTTGFLPHQLLPPTFGGANIMAMVAEALARGGDGRSTPFYVGSGSY